MENFGKRYGYALILLKQLVKTDFKLRYKHSLLGYMWSLLKPLFLFGILYVVFVKIVKVNYGVPHSGIYLLLGIVLWTFFAESTGGSVTSIVGRGDLLRKLNFPKYVIVLATVLSALINLSLNMIIVVFFMLISKDSVNWQLIFVPFLFLELFAFSLGVGIILATTYVRLRDVNYIWEVCLQALFYATPIIFPVTFAPSWLQKILMLNPLAQIIQDLRYILVSSKSPTITSVYGGQVGIRLVPVGIVCITLALALMYFKSRSPKFAEEI